MKLTWFFYSDTNASAQGIEAILSEKSEVFNNVHHLENLLQELKKTNHAILFLKTNTIYNVYELCQQISVKYPHVYIILIVPDNMENMKKAMLVGASNILRHSAEPEEINEVVVQANKYMRHRESKDGSVDFFLPKENSKVISVCSAKGGKGKTSMVVNIAAAFVKQGQKVAIIDADLQFGDIAVHLDLKPNQTIYEWVKEGFERSPASVEKYMVQHESGISVLAAPPRPEFFEIITENHISASIDVLKKIYDVVLIDTPSYLSEVLLKCLAESQDILLLTTRDIPSLRSSKLFIDTLESLQLSEKVKIVLNCDTKNKKIDAEKFENILQYPIFSTLPEHEAVASLSANEGIPFVLKNSRSSLSKGVVALARQLKKEESSVENIKTRRFLIKK